MLFAAYVDAKQKQSVLDYDDLLLYWSHMAAEPAIASDLSARFDHVLVDEYQDTNRLQASILLALKPNGRGLTVVGDDAQSIYSFRGATVRNILDFPAHFNPPAKQITLERNYRSTGPILAASNAVIELASERYTKNLWTDKASAQRPRLVTVADEADQARYIVEQVLEAREQGMKLKSQAVLFRAAHHSAALEIELTRRNIPFVKFGVSIGVPAMGFRAWAACAEVWMSVTPLACRVAAVVMMMAMAMMLEKAIPTSVSRRMRRNSARWPVPSSFNGRFSGWTRWPSASCEDCQMKR
jgi:superfamily I DNA/RNA helicase